MKSRFLKKALAFALAGAIILGAPVIAPTVQVEAAWTWNASTSESGYPKVPAEQITAEADSEESPDYENGGTAASAVDGNPDTYWHTNWHGVNGVSGTTDNMTDNNTITLTLENATTLVGIAYLPRQAAEGNNNGMIKVCDVYVSYDGVSFVEVPAATSNWTYSAGAWDESKAEKELMFTDGSLDDVKKVKLVVTSTRSADASRAYINAAEIGLLMPKVERELVSEETKFWNTEYNKEPDGAALARQEDTDEWLYQIKSKESGEWQNIDGQYFYPTYTPDEELGTGSWMQSSTGSNANFHYSKLTSSQITCTFGDTGYSEVAYAWRATDAGYYRATFANPMGNTNGLPLVVRHSSADNPNIDGDVLFPQTTVNAGYMLSSRIVKAQPGDIIRIGATGNNVWAIGFEPAIEEVSVREYAEQYLQDMRDLNTDQYTNSNVAIFEAEIEALSAVLEGEADDNAITTAVENMEAAYENLAHLYTITYTKDNASPQYLKETYNSNVTVMIDPDTEMTTANGTFVGWCLNGTETIVSTAPSYSLYVAGDMTLEAKYSDEGVAVPASASISNVHAKKNTDGSYNVQFVSQLMAPQGYTLLEAGLVWKADGEISISDQQNGPTAADGNVVNVPQVSSSYQYSVTIKNVSAGHTIHGVAFAKVRDANGDVSWLYSTPDDSGLLQAQ